MVHLQALKFSVQVIGQNMYYNSFQAIDTYDTDTDLWATQQHGAVLGAREEGQVVDVQSVCLAWLQTNTPHCTQELTAFTLCAHIQTEMDHHQTDTNTVVYTHTHTH